MRSNSSSLWAHEKRKKMIAAKKINRQQAKINCLGERGLRCFKENTYDRFVTLASNYADCPINMKFLYQKRISQHLMPRGNYASIMSEDDVFVKQSACKFKRQVTERYGIDNE